MSVALAVLPVAPGGTATGRKTHFIGSTQSYAWCFCHERAFETHRILLFV